MQETIQNPESINSFPALSLNYTAPATRQTAYHFLDHLVNVRGSVGATVCMSRQVLLSRLSQKQKCSCGLYTQSLRLCLFQTQNIVHSILKMLMSLIVPWRSFQIRPQRSLPPLLQWLQNVPFCGYARVVEVFVAPRWTSLDCVGNYSRGPTVPPFLASPFLKIEMYIECFQSVNHRFVFRICGHILVRILTIHSLWHEINLSLSQLL